MELRGPLLLCLCFIFPLCSSDLSSHSVLEPYDFLFDSAVEAYYKGDWLSVILHMEKALRNKATVRKVKTQCRLSCANQTAFGEQPQAGSADPVPGSGSLADLGFFQKILKRADCVKTCESEKLGSPTLHEVTEDVELEFRKRTPYNYLQVAYFKVNLQLEPQQQAPQMFRSSANQSKAEKYPHDLLVVSFTLGSSSPNPQTRTAMPRLKVESASVGVRSALKAWKRLTAAFPVEMIPTIDACNYCLTH